MPEFNLRHSHAPVDTTVMQHIASITDWGERVAAVGSRFNPHAQVQGLKFDAPAIAKELAKFYQAAGCVQWRSQLVTNIQGASLSINPDHSSEEWIHASFGHPRYRSASKSDYYRAVEQDVANRIKGDYLDTLGFRRLHPALYQHCPQLLALLESFAVPVVRVTARTITGHTCYPSDTPANTGGYHTDDSPFELLRVNVAIDNDGTFGLQYEDGTVVHMESGTHAVVNTDVRHRVHIARHTLRSRTHIVIGLAPWLKYDRRRDAWSFNDHAGVTHPYEMAESGLLTSP